MMNFIVDNYIIFLVAGIVLLLGLFGYIMDRKKFEDYRNEIIRSENAAETLGSKANVDEIAVPVPVDEDTNADNDDPMAGLTK